MDGRTDPGLTPRQQRLKWLLDSRPPHAPQLIEIDRHAHVLTEGRARLHLFSNGTRIAIASLIEGWPSGTSDPVVTQVRVLAVPGASEEGDGHVHEFESWIMSVFTAALVVLDEAPTLDALERSVRGSLRP